MKKRVHNTPASTFVNTYARTRQCPPMSKAIDTASYHRTKIVRASTMPF